VCSRLADELPALSKQSLKANPTTLNSSFRQLISIPCTIIGIMSDVPTNFEMKIDAHLIGRLNDSFLRDICDAMLKFMMQTNDII